MSENDVTAGVAVAAILIAAAAVGLAVWSWFRVAALERKVADLLLETLRAARREPTSTAPDFGPPALPTPTATAVNANVNSTETEPPPPVPAPLPAQPIPRPAPERGTLETFLGGRELLVAGVIAVLFGLGFFLKLAIENKWIGAGARIAIGVLAGAAALVVGDRIRARGFAVFGQAIMGLGVGALFLCDHFACVRYGFYERPVAGGVAAIVAAGAAALALHRNAPTLAWLGFAGAFLAPALLGRNEDALEGLTAWLVVADVGVAVLLLRRAWPGLELLSVIATLTYVSAWGERFHGPERDVAAAVCLGALLLVLLATCYAPPFVSSRRLGATAIIGAALATVWAYFLGALLFHAQHEYLLAGAVLCVAAIHGLTAETLHARRPDDRGGVSAIRAVFFATAAGITPIVLSGRLIAPVWAIYGLAVVLAATRMRSRAAVVVGLATIACAGWDVLLFRTTLHSAPFVPILNGPWFAAVVPALCAGLAAGVLEKSPPEVRPFPPLVPAIGAVLAFWLFLSLEFLEWRRRGSGAPMDEQEVRFRAQVAMSVAWALYGAALVAAGFLRTSAPMRWAGLLVLFATVIKVFVSDLDELGTGQRIVSFMVLGVLLVGASALYQRARRNAAPPTDVTPPTNG